MQQDSQRDNDPVTTGTASSAAGPTERLSRRQWIGITSVAAVTLVSIQAFRRFGRGSETGDSVASLTQVTLYSEKECPCCHKWAAHMEANGFVVST